MEGRSSTCGLDGACAAAVLGSGVAAAGVSVLGGDAKETPAAPKGGGETPVSRDCASSNSRISCSGRKSSSTLFQHLLASWTVCMLVAVQQIKW